MLFSETKLSDLSKASILLIVVGFIAVGGAFYFFFELAEDVLDKEKFVADRLAIEFVRDIQAPWLNEVMRWITEVGSVVWITIASVLLVVYLFFFSTLSRWVAVYFIISIGGIALLTKLLKALFERTRPEVLQEFDGTGFSFPSGHSTGSIVFYGFLIYLTVISPLKKYWKWFINIGLGLLIVLIGLSRVYLNVHYFTDICAGFLFGLAWLMVCIAALEITHWHQRRRQLNKEKE